MTIVATTFEKRLVVGGIVIGRIQLARLAFASHAVALDITKVRRGRAEPLACELDQPGLHDHPARRSEEHTSELQSLMRISYAVFCLKKKKNRKQHQNKSTKQHLHHKHT